MRKPPISELEPFGEATLQDPAPVMPRAEIETLVRLLAMAEGDEVKELFSELGPEAARHIGRELRNAAPESAAQKKLYRRALMALMCADLAQEFTPADATTS